MTMNLKILCKRIMGLLILIIVFSLYFTVPVEAASKKKCEEYLPNVKYINRYSVSFESDENNENHYVLTLKPTSDDASLQKALRKVVFKVVKINNVDQNGSQTVSYGHPLTLSGQFAPAADGDQEMIVHLESTEVNADPKCEGKVKFYVGITRGGTEVIEIENIDTPSVTDDTVSSNDKINCDSPKDEFENAFCYAKSQATSKDQAAGSQNLDYTGKFNNKQTFQTLNLETLSLKCDVNKFDTKNGYYVNKTYFYGSGEYSVGNEKYVYHFAPGNTRTSNTIKCKVKCEEAVVVEYGPPVASKAGLCFEYKVKVTSRVSCNMSEKPQPPEEHKKYCTPTPYCKGSESSTIITNQGGPSEEFDACINSCDGGKYTDKCSKKCYKKVYGTNGTKKTTTSDLALYTARLASQSEMDYCLGAGNNKYGGCYYYEGNEIKWSGSNGGRWYQVYPHKDLSSYAVYGNGIYRHVYSDGSHCQDICWWGGCRDKSLYLNPGVAAKDSTNNWNIYNSVVAQCSAKAKCTETTAEFTISVNYKNGNGELVNIKYPYSSEKDYLTSKGKETGIRDTHTKKDTTILCSKSDESTGKCIPKDEYRGCYDDKSADNLYRAEWSFPGSWINNKTGEVTFAVPKDVTVWQHKKGKFCLPFDAQDVNQKWWNYYYYKTSIGKTTSIDNQAYIDACGNDLSRFISFSNDDIDSWNINAETNNFGYFGWNIGVKCFYALNSNPSNSKDSDKCLSDSSYRIRSVDLKNLFPAEDGSRAPGFNWSEYATLTKTPLNDSNNNYFTISPSKYADTVQSLGQGVYSDKYLDYSIDLTRDMIAKLREDLKENNNNYSAFTGDVKTENYVLNYESPLFRNVNGKQAILANSIYPDNASLKCNNMKNYNGGCEE